MVNKINKMLLLTSITALIADYINCKIEITLNWKQFIKNCSDSERIMKISLLCLATFIMNFNSRKYVINKAKK